jgi:hypothetical protein
MFDRMGCPKGHPFCVLVHEFQNTIFEIGRAVYFNPNKMIVFLKLLNQSGFQRKCFYTLLTSKPEVHDLI